MRSECPIRFSLSRRDKAITSSLTITGSGHDKLKRVGHFAAAVWLRYILPATMRRGRIMVVQRS